MVAVMVMVLLVGVWARAPAQTAEGRAGAGPCQLPSHVLSLPFPLSPSVACPSALPLPLPPPLSCVWWAPLSLAVGGAMTGKVTEGGIVGMVWEGVGVGLPWRRLPSLRFGLLL